MKGANTMIKQIKGKSKEVHTVQEQQTGTDTQKEQLSSLEEARKRIAEKKENKRHPQGGKGL